MKNKNCEICFNDIRKEITGDDFTDLNNCPTFYTKKTRNYKKAKELLEKSFNEEMTMQKAISLLEDFNMGVHSYCMMD